MDMNEFWDLHWEHYQLALELDYDEQQAKELALVWTLGEYLF